MDKTFINNLKKPCLHRGVSLEVADDGVRLDGNEFTTMGEVENYLESKPRLDI